MTAQNRPTIKSSWPEPSKSHNFRQRSGSFGSHQSCTVVIKSNTVESNDRGYIYVVDRANTELHILDLIGEARKIAGMT